MKTINNFRIKKKNVLLRVDLNVPTTEGVVTDKSRIISIKSTIQKLIKNQNKIFLLSHFGRPKGKYDKQFSLEFLIEIICKEFGIKKMFFIDRGENILIYIREKDF